MSKREMDDKEFERVRTDTLTAKEKKRLKKERKRKKKNSVLAQVMQAQPRPGQPLFTIIVFFSVVIDIIRTMLRSVLCLVVILLLSAAVVTGIAFTLLKPEYDQYMENARKTVEETTEDTFRFNETTILYYEDGSRISELMKDSDTVYLPYEEIPDDVVKAFVAVEDRSFWTNPGIDIKNIVKAGYDAVISKGENVRGASTITQQLARCIFLNNGVTIDRKLQEMALAVCLTEKYSKEQIMEFYVNNIYYANGYYGIEAAAQGYFSKPASELTLSETAYICAIPNSPTFYDPYNDPDRALERRDLILESMYDVGFISWEELEGAKAENIEINPAPGMNGDYAATYAADCAIRQFMEIDGFTFQYHFETDEELEAYQAAYQEEYEAMREELYRGGYRVYTSIEKDAQQGIQEIVDQFLADTRTDESPDLQAAVVLSDEKGQVKAVIGGESSSGFGLNRAYQSFRQPGSSIKPLVVYAPALEEGYTADSTVKNISVSEAHQKEEDRITYGTPYDLNDLSGSLVSLRTALEQSLNGAAYMIMHDVGVGSCVPYLEEMHFEKIVPEDFTLSTALGGLTYGASPVEMCGAYACLANGGVYREPTCLTSIVDRYGNEMLQGEQEGIVYTMGTASTMKDLLSGVMLRGTGSGLGWYERTDIPAYVKTGTTNDQKDGWMCGWTENDGEINVMSVWVGCDMPKGLQGLWGSTWPGSVWVDSMLSVIKEPDAGIDDVELESEMEGGIAA